MQISVGKNEKFSGEISKFRNGRTASRAGVKNVRVQMQFS